MRLPTYIPKSWSPSQWRPQSWSLSWPAYSHWSPSQWQEWSPSQWQGWGSGWHYAAQPWDTYQEPWAKPRRRMRRQQRGSGRRQGRKYQQTFVPPDARPIVTPSPAAANSPAPAASQLQITPPGPQTPPRGTQTAEMNAREWFVSEIEAPAPKRPKRRSQTPESKNKAAEQSSSSPQTPKKTINKWIPRHQKLCQVLNTSDHAVKNGVVAQDMGVRLCPSFLPKRGVSRNHSGSQLCSSARCDPHIWLCCGDVLQSTSLAIHQRGITRTAPEPELIPCIPGPASHHDEHWDGRRAQHNWS